MKCDRDDGLKILQIVSGLCSLVFIGYKTIGNDEESDAVNWMATLAATMLSMSRMLDNHYSIQGIRQILDAEHQTLVTVKEKLPLATTLEYAELGNKMDVDSSLRAILINKQLDSSLVNLVLFSLAVLSVTGVWSNDSLLTYGGASIAFLCQTHFSFFQLYKYPKLIQEELERDRQAGDDTIKRFDLL